MGRGVSGAFLCPETTFQNRRADVWNKRRERNEGRRNFPPEGKRDACERGTACNPESGKNVWRDADAAGRFAADPSRRIFDPAGPGRLRKDRHVAHHCGLFPPDRGQVLLNGRDITALPPEKRGVHLFELSAGRQRQRLCVGSDRLWQLQHAACAYMTVEYKNDVTVNPPQENLPRPKLSCRWTARPGRSVMKSGSNSANKAFCLYEPGWRFLRKECRRRLPFRSGWCMIE